MSYDFDVEAVELVVNERRRQQLAEGYMPTDDDRHVNGELAQAAAVYACPPDLRLMISDRPQGWPHGWATPRLPKASRLQELAIAGALVLAEIERLLRGDADAGV